MCRLLRAAPSKDLRAYSKGVCADVCDSFLFCDFDDEENVGSTSDLSEEGAVEMIF